MSKLLLVSLIALALCGCNRAANHGTSGLAPGTVPPPGAGTKLPELTLESIAKMSDDDLEGAVTGYVLGKVNYDARTARESLARLTEGEKLVYVTTTLEGEVFNGGFHQYFYNTSGELVADAVQAYTLIGATQHAAITAKAIELAAQEEDLRAQVKASSNELKAFSESYKQTKLADLDEPFYDLDKKEDIRKLRGDYIRKHASEFVSK